MKYLATLVLLTLAFTASAADTSMLVKKQIRTSPTHSAAVYRSNPDTDATKLVTFGLNTGDLFEKNPQAFMYILTDGLSDGLTPDHPMRGRGFLFGYVDGCMKLVPHQFGGNVVGGHIYRRPVAGCLHEGIFPKTTYRFAVSTTPTGIRVVVEWDYKGDWRLVMNAKLPGSYPGNDTIIGVAQDHNRSTYALHNVRQLFGASK